MKVVYPGPLEAVTVEAIPGCEVKKGETCNVPAPIAKALLAQGWQKPAKKATKKRSK